MYWPQNHSIWFHYITWPDHATASHIVVLFFLKLCVLTLCCRYCLPGGSLQREEEVRVGRGQWTQPGLHHCSWAGTQVGFTHTSSCDQTETVHSAAEWFINNQVFGTTALLHIWQPCHPCSSRWSKCAHRFFIFYVFFFFFFSTSSNYKTISISKTLLYLIISRYFSHAFCPEH